jgi:hypothetical protein
MRDTDPMGGFVQPQKYFLDQNSDFDDVKNPNRLNDDSNAAQNDKFSLTQQSMLLLQPIQ